MDAAGAASRSRGRYIKPPSPYLARSRKNSKKVVTHPRQARLQQRYERQHHQRGNSTTGIIIRPDDSEMGEPIPSEPIGADELAADMPSADLGNGDSVLVVMEGVDVGEDDRSLESAGGVLDGGSSVDKAADQSRDHSLKQTLTPSKMRRQRGRKPDKEQIKLANAWRTLVDSLVPVYLEYRRTIHQKHVSAFIHRDIIAGLCKCQRGTGHRVVCLFFECKLTL
jgi:hypothetical protein